MSKPVLKRIADGDSTAVKDCLQQYGGLVCSMARRMLHSVEDADEVVQDIFVELWQKAGRFEPSRGTEATFITMVARRRIIDRQRRAGRGPDVTAIVDDAQVVGSSDHSYAEINDEAAVAKACMGKLKADERQVLELSIFHGLSQSKIADRTGMPLGTVKTNARRGLMRLRELMQSQAVMQKGATG